MAKKMLRKDPKPEPKPEPQPEPKPEVKRQHPDPTGAGAAMLILLRQFRTYYPPGLNPHLDQLHHDAAEVIHEAEMAGIQ